MDIYNMKKFELVSTRLCSIMDKNGNKFEIVSHKLHTFLNYCCKICSHFDIARKKKNFFFGFLIFNDAKKRQAKCPHLEKGFLKLGRPGFLVLAKNDCIMYLYHITNNVHQRKGERVFFYTGCKKKSNQISCFLLQNFWKDLVHNFGLKGN